MPIREYKKCNCGYKPSERYVRMREIVLCPKCGKELESLISKSSFILKGGGWYNSGYTKNVGGD